MRRLFAGLLLAALALLAYAWFSTPEPSHPRPVVTDASDVEPTLTPPGGSGVELVRRQVLDARGTP